MSNNYLIFIDCGKKKQSRHERDKNQYKNNKKPKSPNTTKKIANKFHNGKDKNPIFTISKFQIHGKNTYRNSKYRNTSFR